MTSAAPIVLLSDEDLDAVARGAPRFGDGVAHFVDVAEGVPDVVRLSLRVAGTADTSRVPLRWHLDQPDATASTDHAAVLWIDTESSVPSARCQLRLGAEVVPCPVEIVSTGPASFSRNKPILETDALAETSVLCVGLGSGGSLVVDQLARAGVGRFVLWDMDRIEVHNVGRHVCGLSDIGRRKVLAMRDHLRAINPSVKVECIHQDVLEACGDDGLLARTLTSVDCVMVGTDNNASRFAINDAAWRLGKPTFFGRAFTRACGGDVIQVMPGETPCYACHMHGRVVAEEISSRRDAARVAYADRDVPVQPGLSIDIQPIANMLARLCLLRLCEKAKSPLGRWASELSSPLFLWANRREGEFEDWQPMGRTFDRLSVLRWYAIGVPFNRECTTCGNI